MQGGFAFDQSRRRAIAALWRSMDTTEETAMDFIERMDGIYHLKAMAPRADGGYCATVVSERELRGRTEQAYREDCIDGARMFDDRSSR